MKPRWPRLPSGVLAGLAGAGVLLLLTPRPAEAVTRPYPGPEPCDTTLQACIDGSAAGDVISIGPGTYVTTLTLNKAVSLLGAGRNTTRLEAPPGQRVMLVTGATITPSTVIAGLTISQGSRPSDSGGGVYVTGGARPLLTDVVIADNTARDGGGLAADGSLTLVNVTFRNNRATGPNGLGGGAYVYPGGLTLAGGRFEANSASRGGGLHADHLGATGTEFIGNTADRGVGGGAYVPGYTTLTGARFEGNSAFYGGGLSAGVLVSTDTRFLGNVAFYVAGGALVDHQTTLRGGRFEGNQSGGDGGGLFVDTNSLTLTGTEFIGNTAGGEGGGAYVNGRLVGGSAWLYGGRFEDNHSTGSSGGLYTNNYLSATGTRFVGNTALVDGGGASTAGDSDLIGVHFEGNAATRWGGGFLSGRKLHIAASRFIANRAGAGGGVYHGAGQRVDISNTLFARNRAVGTDPEGAAIWLLPQDALVRHVTISDTAINPSQAIVISSGLTVDIRNTIITRHAVGVERQGSAVTEDYNLFSENATDIVGTVTSGGHSLTGNPAFVDPATGDYHLTAASAAIDQGTDAGVTADFETDPRPLAGGFDIGVDEFTVLLPPPAATLAAPADRTGGTTPTYLWYAVAKATFYYLWVNDAATAPKITQWVSAAEAGCSTGFGTCAFRPGVPLDPGAGRWWIRTWNAAGLGPWSVPFDFTVAPAGLPGRAMLLDPAGTVAGDTPAYTWNAVPGASYYELWVEDARGVAITQWYAAPDVGCALGSGTCTVTPSVPLRPGPVRWWILTWNALGFGPWSVPMDFFVPGVAPGAATLIAPAGGTTGTPVFRWNAAPGATYYYIWVNDASAAPRFTAWYTAGEAGCGAGTGTCSVSLPLALASGAGRWWIRTWNPAGLGPWTAALDFSVP